MTDVAGLRDRPGRRGQAELRLDELFPDRPGHRGPTGAGARGLDVEAGERAVLATREAETAELETGYVDEPDPFASDGPRRAGASSRRAEPGDPGDRFRRIGALSRVGRWRIDPERRGAIAVMAAILVAAVAVGWQALASRPHAEPVSDPTASASLVAGTRSSALTGTTGTRAATGAGGTPSAAAKVIVDVVGRVRRPGLVTLVAGARVADAVRAAGGALAGTNLSSINLARVCVDGEQIAVGVSGAAASAGTSGPASGSGVPGSGVPASGVPAGLVNLNTATVDQLDALPGVGPVMAQRIIAYRTDHGPFTAVTQLQQVSGIGAARYADLSPLVTV